MAVRNSNPAAQVDIDSTLKRIAWAYGCAKKGSPEEARLQTLLIAKAEQVKSQPEDVHGSASCPIPGCGDACVNKLEDEDDADPLESDAVRWTEAAYAEMCIARESEEQ